MAKLRSLNVEDNSLLERVIKANTNPMLVLEEETNPTYYNTVQDKLEALKDLDLSSTKVLFVWEGKYKTDVFELQESDIERIYILLNK